MRKQLSTRTINFTLGTQSATATTDANGIATTALKLKLKNGTYTMYATYTPEGNDAGHYVGSGVITSFKLQAK